MPTMPFRLLGLMGAGVLVVAAPALAEPAWLPSHVRPESSLRPLFEQAPQRSPATRGLVAQLETMDVTAYIRARAVDRSNLAGLFSIARMVRPSSRRAW